MTGTLELLRGAEVSDAVWLPHPAQGAGLQIEVRSQNAVNLALTHNGVPLISQIAVSKSSDLIAGLDVFAHLEEVDDHVPGSRRSLWVLAAGEVATWTNLGDVVAARYTHVGTSSGDSLVEGAT